MTRIKLLITVVLTLALAWSAGCGSNESAAEGGDSSAVAAAEGTMESDGENFGADAEAEEDDGEEEEKKEKKRREKSTTVQASTAFTGDLVQPVIAEGTIRARHTTEIRTEIAGKLIRVAAKEGQSVRRGQLIAKIDDREYVVAEAEARARYLQALSLLAIEEDDFEVQELAQEMRDEFNNLEEMERLGKITRAERMAREVELDIQALKEGKFRIEIAAARSGVSEARASLERARLNLERSEIRAPFAGIITGLTLTAGEHVITNQTVCSLVDNVNLEAEVGVLEADLGYVSVGKPTLLAVPALDETLHVEVDVVSPQFDRESRTCEVLIRVTNPEGNLRPGMFVRAIIAGRTFPNRMLVPREAILTRDGRPLLFKVEGDRAKWLYVELGEANDNLVEIKKVIQGGSLQPGDKVVVSDHLTLAHDAKIRVKKTLATSDPWITFNRADG